ncbi:MAG: ABC transporter permease subunit [Cyanobacteria bacterium SBLK]|nr:ABC transporter permease subunit [Cyanobacteria bacterium SBLK]
MILNPFELYTIPLEEWLKPIINVLVDRFDPFLQATIGTPVGWVVNSFEFFLQEIPPTIFLIILGLLAWQFMGGKMAIYSIVALSFVGFIGAWPEAMTTLSVTIAAVIFCFALGIPLGILAARNNLIESILLPILDTMQTLPPFVYLVPVVMLFGVGAVPGTIVTVIAALPPLIRLTNVGIRQVSPEIVAGAFALGATANQVLWSIQIPLAMPTILVGANQTILRALSMVVVASMIAVRGLGMMVLKGIGLLNIESAIVGGIGIVAIAILLDRCTQALGQPQKIPWQQRGLVGLLLSIKLKIR